MYYVLVVLSVAVSVAVSDMISEISSEYFAHYIVENEAVDIGLKEPPSATKPDPSA